jgi:hypothetical protein
MEFANLLPLFGFLLALKMSAPTGPGELGMVGCRRLAARLMLFCFCMIPRGNRRVRMEIAKLLYYAHLRRTCILVLMGSS